MSWFPRNNKILMTILFCFQICFQELLTVIILDFCRWISIYCSQNSMHKDFLSYGAFRNTYCSCFSTDALYENVSFWHWNITPPCLKIYCSSMSCLTEDITKDNARIVPPDIIRWWMEEVEEDQFVSEPAPNSSLLLDNTAGFSLSHMSVRP